MDRRSLRQRGREGRALGGRRALAGLLRQKQGRPHGFGGAGGRGACGGRCGRWPGPLAAARVHAAFPRGTGDVLDAQLPLRLWGCPLSAPVHNRSTSSRGGGDPLILGGGRRQPSAGGGEGRLGTASLSPAPSRSSLLPAPPSASFPSPAAPPSALPPPPSASPDPLVVANRRSSRSSRGPTPTNAAPSASPIWSSAPSTFGGPAGNADPQRHRPRQRSAGQA